MALEVATIAHKDDIPSWTLLAETGTASARNSVAKVFGVTELLEHILLSLLNSCQHGTSVGGDPIAQLFRLQRVSRDFHNTIDRSSLLHCAMGLRLPESESMGSKLEAKQPLQVSSSEVLHRFFIDEKFALSRSFELRGVQVLLRDEEDGGYRGMRPKNAATYWKRIGTRSSETFSSPLAVSLTLVCNYSWRWEGPRPTLGYKRMVYEPPGSRELKQWAFPHGSWRRARLCLLAIPVCVGVIVRERYNWNSEKDTVYKIDETGRMTLGEMVDWLEEVRKETTDHPA